MPLSAVAYALYGVMRLPVVVGPNRTLMDLGIIRQTPAQNYT